MAEAAVRVLADRGQAPAGGLVVAPVAGPRPHPSIAVVVGDHPEPGAGSLAAAEALEGLVKQVSTGDAVWVLLSGGTTSLIGAPQPGIAAPRAQGALRAAASIGPRHQGDEPRAEAVHPMERGPARAKPRATRTCAATSSRM